LRNKYFTVLLSLVCCVSFALGATTKKKATKKSSSTAVHKKGVPAATGKRPTSSTASHSRRRTTTTAASRTRKPAQRSQATPTPERYKEIQQALADKGYYKGEVNGTWGPESVDALKRSQQENKLQVDGKLGSLSLIALGLGPKRQASNDVVAPMPQKTEPQ